MNECDRCGSTHLVDVESGLCPYCDVWVNKWNKVEDVGSEEENVRRWYKRNRHRFPTETRAVFDVVVDEIKEIEKPKREINVEEVIEKTLISIMCTAFVMMIGLVMFLVFTEGPLVFGITVIVFCVISYILWFRKRED